MIAFKPAKRYCSASRLGHSTPSYQHNAKTDESDTNNA
jgi:hypothetical protein